MDKAYRLREMLIQHQKELCYYSQMQTFASSTYEKKYYQNLVDERTEELIHVLERMMIHSYELNSDNMQNNNTIEGIPINEVPLNEEEGNQNQEDDEVKVFTLDELANYNGENGKPTYVAVNGVVYDFSTAIPWVNGKHNGLTAGMDLTAQFTRCHRGMIQTLERYPIVGLLESRIDETGE